MRTLGPALLALALLAPACKREAAPATSAAGSTGAAQPKKLVSLPPMPASTSAEVEAHAEVTPAQPRQVLYWSSAACTDPNGKIFGAAPVDPKNGTGFLEIFVSQGTVAHFCAARVDASGKVTAVGEDAKGAQTLKGEGEIELGGKMTLQPVKPFDAPDELKKNAR